MRRKKFTDDHPAAGIRRHGSGWQAEVRVSGHPRWTKTFPLETPIEAMTAWRKDEKARLRLARGPRATKGTFPADVTTYLQLVRAMPSIKDRTYQMQCWVDVLGVVPTSSVDDRQIRLARDDWREHGPKMVWRRHTDGRRGGALVAVDAPLSPQTVNLRLRALENFFTVMFPGEPNPVRRVPELDDDGGDADRSLPYEIIDAIFAEIPERRYDRALTPAQAVAVQREARRPGANASAIAAQYGISETMVRRLRQSDTPRKDSASRSKVRLELLAYASVTPAEMKRLTPKHVSVEHSWIDTGRRRKGKGVTTGRRPLTARGVAALTRFVDANAFGTFSVDSLGDVFARGVRKLIRRLDAGTAAERAIAAWLRAMKPTQYDLRHSYVTEVLAHSGDFHATQLLVGHADFRTTLGYGKRAINPVLRAALDKVDAAGGFKGKSRTA